MTTAHRMRCALVLAAVACNEPQPEPLEPAELVQRCGDAAPVELLALPPDEVAVFAQWIGQRVLVHVEARPNENEIERRIVSVGPCGEDPRLVLDVDAYPVASAAPDAPRLASSLGDQALHWIDPTGQRPAQLVGRGAVAGEHDGSPYVALLSDDDTSASLHRMVVDGDTFMLETILADLAPSTATSSQGPDDRAFVITLDAELLEVDLATAATTPVASLVDTFLEVPDGRFVAYLSARDPESSSLFTPWYVLDRQTGALAELGHGDFAQLGGTAIYSLRDDVTDVVMLPGLHRHALEGVWFSFEPVGDGRIVAGRLLPHETDSQWEFWIFDAPEAEPRRLAFRGAPSQFRVRNGELFVADEDLLRVPLDGSPPERVAASVLQPLWLADGRLLTVRHASDDGTGDLVVLDHDRNAGLVDEHVRTDVDRLNVFQRDDQGPAFFYQVHDPAGDRRALYLVELAP